MEIIGILGKEIIFYGYFESMEPLYKPYDYNFKRIDLNFQNI
jgi:hypothetical protein